MKVKAIKEYNDLQLKRLVQKDEELTVSAERGKVLINAMVAVEIAEKITEIAEATTEEITAIEPKKKAKKKVTNE